jgi:hypothetical protein
VSLCIVSPLFPWLASVQVADLAADARLKLSAVFPKASLRVLLQAIARSALQLVHVEGTWSGAAASLQKVAL